MRNHRGCGWQVRQMLTLGLWVVVLCYVVLLYRSLSHASHQVSLLDNAQAEPPSPPPLLELLILLQPSPVDGGNQLKRLATIDRESWGQWTSQSMQLAGLVSIFAGVPRATLEAQATTQNDVLEQFSQIHILPLSPPPLEVTKGEDKSQPTQAAYAYMIEQFITVPLLSQRPFKWFFFANDHSFVIPDNLFCFLRGFDRDKRDEDLPVYSGNILQRGMFRNVRLKFASGGAGVVLSHTALKLLVVTWVLTDNPLVNLPSSQCSAQEYRGIGAKLREIKAQGQGQGQEGDEYVQAINLVGLGGQELGCALFRIKVWLQLLSTATVRMQLTIQISSKVSLLVSGGDHLLVVNYQTKFDTDRGHTPIVKVLNREALARCDAVTAWDRINPGLVVAYCLQHVYTAAPLTTTTTAAAAERFNVYGALRTITGDVDTWYTECKLNLPPGSLENKHQVPTPLAVASDFVSLHYVSQRESTLLYQILSRKLFIKSPQELLQLWPATNKEAGHYSRKIKNGLVEAEALYNFLLNKTVIHSTCPVPSITYY